MKPSMQRALVRCRLGSRERSGFSRDSADRRWVADYEGSCNGRQSFKGCPRLALRQASDRGTPSVLKDKCCVIEMS